MISETTSPKRLQNPSYPAISLPDAIAKVGTIYEKIARRKQSRMGIAHSLGYTGLNGASVTVMASLTKYGLLEGRGDEIRLSDDALVIAIEEVNSPERQQAIARSALRPQLFAELNRYFSGHVPTESQVRIWLEKRGFAPSAARDAGHAFRETIELVNAEGWPYNSDQATAPDGVAGTMETQPLPQAGAMTPPKASAASPPIGPGQGFNQDVFSLAEGSVILSWPEGLKPESLPDLEDWFELQLRKIGRTIGAPPRPKKGPSGSA
jgi:hypothetical protein